MFFGRMASLCTSMEKKSLNPLERLFQGIIKNLAHILFLMESDCTKHEKSPPWKSNQISYAFSVETLLHEHALRKLEFQIMSLSLKIFS